MARWRPTRPFLYGPERGRQCLTEIEHILQKFRQRNPAYSASRQPFKPSDAILITYGDQIQELNRPPLLTLGEFLRKKASGIISGVHLLPFFPYSSNDGFSVIDYWRVDPALGTWDHIGRLGADFDLMFDAVINHISAQSQ